VLKLSSNGSDVFPKVKLSFEVSECKPLLHGGLLEDQTAFAAACLGHILMMYPAGTHVFIAGHSMARAYTRPFFGSIKARFVGFSVPVGGVNDKKRLRLS
jgi:hypothetical protein